MIKIENNMIKIESDEKDSIVASTNNTDKKQIVFTQISRYGDKRIFTQILDNLFTIEVENSNFSRCGFEEHPETKEIIYNFVDFDGGPFLSVGSILCRDYNKKMDHKITKIIRDKIKNSYELVTELIAINTNYLPHL